MCVTYLFVFPPQLFHPSCFEDYKNVSNWSVNHLHIAHITFRRVTCCLLSPQSSYIDATPSPNKVLTEHPLSTFIKKEEEEEDTSCAAAVKQEVDCDAVEPPDVKKEEEEEVLTEEVQSDQNKL